MCNFLFKTHWVHTCSYYRCCERNWTMWRLFRKPHFKFKSHLRHWSCCLSHKTYQKVKLKVCLCRLKQEVMQTDRQTEVLAYVCFSSSNIWFSCRCIHNPRDRLFLTVRPILSVLRTQRRQKSTNSFPCLYECLKITRYHQLTCSSVIRPSNSARKKTTFQHGNK